MAEIEFLNIDLDIESQQDIVPIIKGFGNNVCIMSNEYSDGIYTATFETGLSEENEIISAYISMINGFNLEAREAWNNCTKREFNFGYNSGENPNVFSSEITTSSIKSIQDISGSIITIYGQGQ